MIISAPQPKISGEFYLEIRSESGFVLESRKCKNMILDGGIDRFLGFNDGGHHEMPWGLEDAIGIMGPQGGSLYLGSGGGFVSPSDTSLQAPISEHNFGPYLPGPVVTRSGNVVTTSWQREISFLTGETIAEIGVGPESHMEDNRLWSRALVYPPIVPDPYPSLILYARYSVSVEIPEVWTDLQMVAGIQREVSVTPSSDTGPWGAVMGSDWRYSLVPGPLIKVDSEEMQLIDNQYRPNRMAVWTFNSEFSSNKDDMLLTCSLEYTPEIWAVDTTTLNTEFRIRSGVPISEISMDVRMFGPSRLGEYTISCDPPLSVGSGHYMAMFRAESKHGVIRQ